MKKITSLKVSELTLDMDNPRFGELYTKSNKEEDLIEYLLFNESGFVQRGKREVEMTYTVPGNPEIQV